jgi:serine/threonine protein kinase
MVLDRRKAFGLATLPEQARGQPQIDARADVFALGCVLYKCSTGCAPFQGAGMLAVLAKVLLEDPPRLRELRGDIPEALDSLSLGGCQSCTTKTGKPDTATL